MIIKNQISECGRKSLLTIKDAKEGSYRSLGGNEEYTILPKAKKQIKEWVYKHHSFKSDRHGVEMEFCYV